MPDDCSNAEHKSRCHERALRLLGQRAHSVHELRNKLIRKGFDTAIVDDEISELLRYRLLDDQSFAEAYCREKLIGSRAIGPIRIRRDLLKRGIDSGIIQQVLQDIEDEDEPDATYERALAAAHSKLRLIQDRSDSRKVRGKIIRFLQGRGFPQSTIMQVLDQLTLSMHD